MKNYMFRIEKNHPAFLSEYNYFDFQKMFLCLRCLLNLSIYFDSTWFQITFEDRIKIRPDSNDFLR